MMDITDGLLSSSQRPPRPARLNPFAFPSDTDLRFILLILCALGATLWVYNNAIWQPKGDVLASAKLVLGCERSSGLRNVMHEVAEKNPKGQADFATASAIYAQCVAPLELQNTRRMLIGIGLLLLVAGGIYLAFPVWKRWRKRLVPLPPEDMPEVMAELTALCREAELKKQPQFLWNPLNLVSEGLAFGCMGRYAVALTGGLVKQAYEDPPTFRAVIRHELAHLRNGDIDKTYFSVAIWWAFVITALVPFVAYLIPHSLKTLALTDLTFPLDIGLRMLALTVLVLLMRNAVLRARELYADARASRWDGPAGALARVLECLPQTRPGHRWKILQLTQTHPEPQVRRATLDDSWPLLQMGFWDALGAGVAAGIVFDALDWLFSSLAGSLQISNLPSVLAGLIFGGLAAGVVGSGVWRATCASLLQGKTARGVGWIALGMASGIMLGQSLSLSSVGDTLPSFTLLGNYLTDYTVWSLILLLSLWLILRWIVIAAATWLQVTTTTSMLLWSARLGLFIAGSFWAVCFGPLIVVQSLFSISANLGGIGLLVDFLLFFVTLFLQPFFVIGLLALWAFPFAARFCRRRTPGTAQPGWSWLLSPSRQVIPGEQEPVQFKQATLVALVGALLFCGVMLALRLWLRLSVPEAVRDMIAFKLALANWIVSRAAVIQGGIAIVTAAWVHRSNVLLALFAAFLAGCVMTIETLGLNVVFGGAITLDFSWIILSGIVIPGGSLAVLLAPLTALLAKRTGPTMRTALVGALIYCGLILCVAMSIRFITHAHLTSDLFTTAEVTLLIVFQVVVGAFVAGHSLRRGWLYGLFAAGITGFVGGCMGLPLTTTNAISSFVQSSTIILAGAFIAIAGVLLGLCCTFRDSPR